MSNPIERALGAVEHAAGRFGETVEHDAQWFTRKPPAHPTTGPQSQPAQQEEAMTETAQAAQPGAPVVPFWDAVHLNLATFVDRAETFLPKLRDVATNAYLDDVIEAVLTGTGQGLAEEVFAGIVTLLKSKPENALDAALALVGIVAHKHAAAPSAPAAAPAAPAGPSFTPAGQQVASPRTAVV